LSFHTCFRYRQGVLCCEAVPIPKIAAEIGTPVYIYSASAMKNAYRRLDSALEGFSRLRRGPARTSRGLPHKICFSVKSNSNQSVLRLFARLGAGFDVVSAGELYRLRRIGVPGDRIVFSGVGKTEKEIIEAVRSRVFLLNIESEAELREVARQAQRLRTPVRVGIRVNPDVGANTHPHISTGIYSHKFGVRWQDVPRIAEAVAHHRWLRLCGLSFHIGSQILTLAPIRRALRRTRVLFEQLRAGVPSLQYLDVGGGLGIGYGSEDVPAIEDYAKLLLEELARSPRPEASGPGLDCFLLLEPGRVLVGSAGILVTSVLLTKENRGKRFVVADAAMNDFLRPALYGARHPILPVRPSARRGRREQVEVVGPICESGDSFGTHLMGKVRPGDLLVLADVGAYGFSLSSNYNSRLRPAEVLVEGKRFRLVRRRESPRDLVRGES
jgi:diaminopimelate decarboxylase